MEKANNIPSFESLMAAIKKDAQERKFQDVPVEAWAEWDVKTNLSKASEEVKEKIRNGLPF